jgi:hypothetical protein
MSEEKKICPFTILEDWCCKEKCMAWREMGHNDWDCALIRNGKK